MSGLRQRMLFVASCGGNYKSLDERPEFKSWMSNQ